MSIQSKSVELTSSLRLAYLETDGTGRPVLLLHGLTDSSEGYQPVMAALEDGYHLYALDFRGHGGSEHRPPYRLADYAADTAQFIEVVIGRPAVIVGHSLGAMVAAYLAATRPDLVVAAYLEDPPYFAAYDPGRLQREVFHPTFVETRELVEEHRAEGHDLDHLTERVADRPFRLPGKVFRFGDVAPPEMVRWRARTLSVLDPRTLDPALDGTLIEGFEPDLLRRITPPTHVLCGNWHLGGAVTGDDVGRWTDAVEGATTTVVEEFGHVFHGFPLALPRYLEDLRGFLVRVETIEAQSS